jgi:hypothetical protein
MNSPPIVIARLDRAILFGGRKEDATVKPWHDEREGLEEL